MSRFNFFYFIREGVRNMFSHGFMSFASIGITVACLIIMGTFTLVAVNANAMLEELESRNQMLAFVDEALTDEEAKALEATLEQIPNVADATFISNAEAAAEFRAKYEGDELFQGLPDENFRHRYTIDLEDIGFMAATRDTLENNTPGIADVNALENEAEGFITIRNVAGVVCIVLIAVLFLVSVFIIANTIKLATFSRREEIAIMKMCGATNWFIRWPFLVEGLLLGLTGGLVAYVCQWGVYSLIGKAMAESGILEIINMIPFHSLAGVVLPVFVAVSLVIGGGGSAFAIRKFLQV